MRITASLVLYRNDPAIFESAIRSVIAAKGGAMLSIVDNSPAPLRRPLFDDPRVIYDYAGENLGFGAGHNRAFARIAAQSDVHFIVNPDVEFGIDVLSDLCDVFAAAPDIMAAMPDIVDGEGHRQNLCKALPGPMTLIGRRFVPFASLRDAIDERYEFRDLPRAGIVDIPNLSGCFLAVRSKAFAQVGGFDPRYFMYLEDIDLVRRLGDHGRTVYIPSTAVTHAHARGSYRFGRLMFTHIRSAIKYFNRWGWLHDPGRASRNKAARRAVSTFRS